MSPKLIYIAQHFGALIIFMFACSGIGSFVSRFFVDARRLDRGLRFAISILTGLGVFIFALLVLGVTSQFRPIWIYSLLVAGSILALVMAWPTLKGGSALIGAQEFSLAVYPPHWSSVAVAIFALCTALSPLCPPYMWDELAYHLPHAQQWAKSGSLTVTPWLRYPWFPFNYNLLYAASLSVYDDVFTHLLNAAAGWLVALLLWRFGVQHKARVTGCLAAILWLYYSRDGYSNAYVDFGTAVFVLGALILLVESQSLGRPDRSAVLASFLLGVAVGIKYQALVFLPLFALVLVYQKGSRRHLLMATGAFALPCAYWYIRNFWFTGDPFDPMGGKLFGFYDWNLQDYNYQLLDVRNGRGWPPELLWPAALSPLLLIVRSTPGAIKILVIFSIYSVLLWAYTSHFPRYLMPSAPMLCLLSAWVILVPINLLRQVKEPLLNPVKPVIDRMRVVCYSAISLLGFESPRSPEPRQKIHHASESRFPTGRAFLIKTHAVPWLANALIVVASWNAVSHNLNRDFHNIAATTQERETFLERELAEYQGILGFLRNHPKRRVYQNGMEAVLYYAPQPIYGDHFGPWRYRDFMVTPPAEMAQKLKDAGLDTIVVRVRWNQEPLNAPGFSTYFKELYRDPIFHAYGLQQ